MTALNFPANPSNGDVYENYQYDGTDGVWKRLPSSSLGINGLADVTINSPADGQALVYDSGTSEWVNEPTVINTDGDPGTKIYVGTTDPSGTYTLEAGDIWIEV